MATPPAQLPLVLPVHPPHRSGPCRGFSSFSGSLLPFGATSTAAAVPQGRRRRANAVSIPRPAFVHLREVSERKDDEDEDVAMRWAAEEGMPTSPRESERKGSAAGMEWEGVVKGMEDVGLNGGEAALGGASTFADNPVSRSSFPSSRISPPASLLLSLPPLPSVTPVSPPTSLALQLALAPSSSTWATSAPTSSPPRPLKRNRTAFAGDADDAGAREAKRFAACGYFDLIAAASSATAFGLASSIDLRQRARRTMTAPRHRRMPMSRTVSVM